MASRVQLVPPLDPGIATASMPQVPAPQTPGVVATGDRFGCGIRSRVGIVSLASLLLLAPACRDDARGPGKPPGQSQTSSEPAAGAQRNLDSEQLARLAHADRLRTEALESYRRGARDAGDRALIEALAIYEREGRLSADLSPLHHELIVNANHRGQFGEAAERCRDWLSHYPDDVAHLETLASLLFRAGRFPEARDVLRRLLRSAPERLRWWRQLVSVLLETGEAVEAGTIATRLLAESERLPPEERLAGDRVAAKAFVHLEDYRAAREPLERLVAAEPDNAQFRLDRARVYRALGPRDVARDELLALREHPALGDAALESLARLELDEGKLAAAIEALERLLTRTPWNAAGYLLLLQIQSRLGHAELVQSLGAARESLAISQREGAKSFAASASGDAATAAWHRALSFDAAGRFGEAEAVLSDSQVAGEPRARTALAMLYLSWGRGRDASRVLAERDAESVSDRVLLASALEQTGDARGALALLDAATIDAIEDPTMLAEIAAWALAEDELALARRLTESDRLGPDASAAVLSSPRLRARRAEVLIRSGEAERAREELEPLADRGELSDLEAIWLAQSRRETGAPANESLSLLDALRPPANGSLEALRVRVRVLESAGDTEARARVAEELARVEAALEQRTRLREEIALAEWESSWKLRVELAESLASSDRTAALRAARIATAAAPDQAPAWRLVARLADRPEELFLRRHAWWHVLRIEPDDATAREELARSEVPRA